LVYIILDIGETKMTEKSIQEIELETTNRYIVYDADSGDMLYTHETMREPGSYYGEQDPEEDAVVEMARTEYDERNLKVMKAPQGFEMKPDVTYSIDTYSGEIKESTSAAMTFREFIKQPD